MSVAAQLLIEQRWIVVADVARLVGYNHGSHFSRAFRRRYGLSPAAFREAGLQAAALRAQGLQAALQAEEGS